MRKSHYGPIRCDRCGYVLKAYDLLVLKALGSDAPLHCACLSPLQRTRAFVKLSGTRCIFCGLQLLLPDLVDHFNQHHGRVVVNWP